MSRFSTPRAAAANSVQASRWCHLLSAAALLPVAMNLSAAESNSPTYAELAPLLAERCTPCHQGTTAPLGLRLDTYEHLLQGSQRGPVVRRGEPAASELIRRLRGDSLPRMPMTGPPFLTEPQIASFEGWIAAGMPRGAPGPAAAPASPPLPGPGETVDYRHVAPIFATRCAKCHADQGLMGVAPEGYRLTSHAATLASEDRARVVPGNPQASELLRRIRGDALPRMPFDGPPYLGEREIALIERWIADGARDSAGVAARLPVGAGVRLHGRLGQQGQLDGLSLTIDRRTRIDKSPRSGDYVEVRGQLDATGNVVVHRLRRR